MHPIIPIIVLSIGVALCVVSPIVMYWASTLPRRCRLPKGTHVHLDIETGGVVSGAAVFVIAAHAVNERGDTIKSQAWRVNKESALMYGFFDDGTRKWWSEQSPEAQHACFDEAPRISLPSALQGLHAFVSEIKGDFYVWGNSPTIDCTLLHAMFAATGTTAPWEHWQEMCVRTIANVSRDLGFDAKHYTPFEGERHVALDDARHQAKYTSIILGRLGVSKR